MISIPFSGSKKAWVKHVNKLVKENGYTASMEVFGGSCVLSANLFNEGIVKHAIINDYDGLFDDYDEFLDVKDRIVRKALEKGLRPTNHNSNGEYRLEKDGSKTYLRSVMLSKNDRAILQEIISEENPKWYRLLALGSNFVFSSKAADKTVNLLDFAMFNRYLKTDKQRTYLKTIKKMERYSLDWREFLKLTGTLDKADTILIVDPPYHESSQYQYTNAFKAENTLALLTELEELGFDYLFFHEAPELIERLNGEVFWHHKARVSSTKQREEYMVYVRQAKRPAQLQFNI